MSIVTLARAKAHVRVTHDFDDEQLQHYIDAAEDYAARYMGRESLEDLLIEPDSDSDQSSEEAPRLPASVEQAVLLLVGDYYALREAQVTGTILTQNPAAESLMHFYRIGLGA